MQSEQQLNCTAQRVHRAPKPMTREFQVLYRETGVPPCEAFIQNSQDVEVVPIGPVLTVAVQCEAEDQIRADFEKAGLAVVSINFVRPVVDWAKPNFNLDEAGAFVGQKGVTFSKVKGGGEIPWVDYGNGLVPRVLLEQFLAKRLNKAGKQIARELAEA